MKRIHITASREYDVFIQNGIFFELGERMLNLIRGRRVMIVSDSQVAPLYLNQAETLLSAQRFQVFSHVIPSGEASKNGENYLNLLETLAEHQLTRADALIALGGGVVGDLTGFAAATYLRGIAFVQIPTTLLACVDSSVGGKTAIDLRAGKNLAGAFYQPSLVLCDPKMLKTLTKTVFAEGCAEVIKYGMLGSRELLDRLLETPIDLQAEYVIGKCVEMKRDIVEKDEFDTGRRQLLNLGHSFAHAIEALSEYEIPHGCAVAIGMVIITRAAVAKGLCPQECLDTLLTLLKQYHLPTHSDYPAEALADKALSDKKRMGDRFTLVVPTSMGTSELVQISVHELMDWARLGVEA